VPSSMWCHIQ